jgi:hypothetical protein
MAALVAAIQVYIAADQPVDRRNQYGGDGV